MESTYADSCFQLVDVQSKGFISGQEAVGFFSKSGLEKAKLRQIWSEANERQGSELNRNEFHVALRLIAMAQMGEADITKQRLMQIGNSNIPLARFQGVPIPSQQQQHNSLQAPAPQQYYGTNGGSFQQQQHHSQQQYQTTTPPSPSQSSWGLTPAEKEKYANLFRMTDTDSDGYVLGTEAVPLFQKSGLDRSVLRDVWTLADSGSNDAKLDLKEFSIAMHLIVCVSKRSMTLPAAVPAEMNASFEYSMPQASSPMPPHSQPAAVCSPMNFASSNNAGPGFSATSDDTATNSTNGDVPSSSVSVTKDPLDAFASLAPPISPAVASISRQGSLDGSTVNCGATPRNSLSTPAVAGESSGATPRSSIPDSGVLYTGAQPAINQQMLPPGPRVQPNNMLGATADTAKLRELQAIQQEAESLLPQLTSVNLNGEERRSVLKKEEQNLEAAAERVLTLQKLLHQAYTVTLEHEVLKQQVNKSESTVQVVRKMIQEELELATKLEKEIESSTNAVFETSSQKAVSSSSLSTGADPFADFEN